MPYCASCHTCFGSRSFSVTVFTIWNFLPFDIHNSCLLSSFRLQLKTFFFQHLAILVPCLTPSPQIQRVSCRHYCALYKFIYLLIYIPIWTVHSLMISGSLCMNGLRHLKTTFRSLLSASDREQSKTSMNYVSVDIFFSFFGCCGCMCLMLLQSSEHFKMYNLLI